MRAGFKTALRRRATSCRSAGSSNVIAGLSDHDNQYKSSRVPLPFQPPRGFIAMRAGRNRAAPLDTSTRVKLGLVTAYCCIVGLLWCYQGFLVQFN